MHKVENQPPLLGDYNLFSSDKTLCELVEDDKSLTQLGEILGRKDTLHKGHLANQNIPQLMTHDRQGHRIDQVEYHPAYHELFSLSVKNGIHSSPWAEPKEGAHVSRAAKHYMMYQVESGHICPVTMTYGSVPAISHQPEIAKEWLPKIFSTEYDPRFLPAHEKKGALIGMAMTEKQGGSDIRTNTTEAKPIGSRGPGKEYLINGHKWFCSAPMLDAFLMLAQTEKGPSCFFVPRWTPEGKQNPFKIQRLKNKLGDRSNASSEIELENTWGRLIGEEGRGIPIIIEMATYTRLDCSIASAAIMRQGTAQAIQHATHRIAFGKVLVQQPIMQKLLADLALETETTLSLTMKIAKAYDNQEDENEKAFRRIATAIAKYWHTKRSITHSYEAMEVHGGNGYVEDAPMARLYRQAPVNSIWEGSGNVMCLDVLRAMQKEPESIQALQNELVKHKGLHKNYDQLLLDIEGAMKKPTELLANARWLVEKLALALQFCSLAERQSSNVEIFADSRLLNGGPNTFGALPDSENLEAIIDEARAF